MFGPKNLSLFNYQREERLEVLIPRIFANWYPTPYCLIKELMETYTDFGELVWDPACGVGTTGLVGLELKRRTILSDISPVAVLYSRLLLNYYDFNCVREQEEKLREAYQRHNQLLSLFGGEEFGLSLPYDRKFNLLYRKGIKTIGKLFSPGTREFISLLLREINKIRDYHLKNIFMGVLLLNICRWSYLEYDFKKDRYRIEARKAKKEPGYGSFTSSLYQILDYKTAVMEAHSRKVNGLPQVYLQSFCASLPVKDKLDYIIIHWPESNFSNRSHFFIEETFLGERTGGGELVYDYQLPGKLQLKSTVRSFMENTFDYLKPGKKMSVICEPSLPLVSILFQAGMEAGFVISKDEVKLYEVPGEGKKYFVLTFTRRKKNQMVMGILNKLKKETLYDSEAVIIRQIKQFLLRKRGATAEEIRNYLLTEHFYSVQIEKTLQDILEEIFTFTNGFWVYQKNLTENSPEQYVLKNFKTLVTELTYLLLLERESYLTFSSLKHCLKHISPRLVYSTGYFHSLEQIKEEKGFSYPGQVMDYLLARACRKKKESPEKVLRRLLKDSPLFRIIEGNYILLTRWDSRILFPVFLDILQKMQESGQRDRVTEIAEKALRILPEAGLDQRSTNRLERYLSNILDKS